MPWTLRLRKPGGQPPDARATDGCRGLVARQQHQRADVAEVALQTGEDPGQMPTQPVDGPAGDVEQVLVVVEQDRDHEAGPAVGQVDAPGRHLAQVQNVAEELEQFCFLVDHPPGQQPPVGVVDHHAVVMGLAGVDTSQIAVTRFSAGRVRTSTTDDLAVESLLSDQCRNS